jgi:hypothetical protein
MNVSCLETCIYCIYRTYTGCPRRKGQYSGHGVGHSKQKTLYEHVSYSKQFLRYSHLNVNRKIVDKKQILRVHIVSNIGIYCSRDRVGTSPSTITTANWRFTQIHMLQTVAQQGKREGQYWAPKSYNLYSQTALTRKPFGIGHMFIQTFLLRMTDTVTFQNIDLSSWDTLYTLQVVCALVT